jgi:branched-subunit amino acid aminotransferase/4-amino-4-deoxychorismate lyase
VTDRFPCLVNGRLVPFGEPAVRADDTGFQLGLSVFDTVLWEDGALTFLDDHLGAAELEIPWPPAADPREALAELVRAIGADFPLALRMTLSRGPEGGEPTFAVTARRVVRPADPGVVVTLASEPRRAGDPLGRVKSTNRIAYVHAREEAQAQGAFEALFVSDEGDVLEGTISNVFCVVDGVLLTPAVERGCLPGTSRGRLLALLEHEPLVLSGREVRVEVGLLDVSALERASEVFLTNTTGGVIPVIEVRGVRDALPGAAGPVASTLRERLRRERVRDRESAS